MRPLYLRLRRHAKTRRGHVNVRDVVQLARLAREWNVSQQAILSAVEQVGTEINEVHLCVERARNTRSCGPA
jgi:Zn-dependent peptidase ImmA (M78 family)